MSVNGFGSGYLPTYFEININNGQNILIFDNWEITEDIQFGERHYPEVHKSQMGKASKVSARNPMKLAVKFNLCYPKTINKLNDLLALTRDRYTMLIRLYGYKDWPAASPAFQSGNTFDLDCIVDHPADLSWRHQARGLGINKDQTPEFIFWEAETLETPLKSDITGGLFLAQDGSPVLVATTASTGAPKTTITTT